MSDKVKTSKFSCLCCGTCCSKYQPRISREEAGSIAGNLNLDLDNFLRNYTDPRWPGTESFLIRHREGACIFLQGSSNDTKRLCLIHAFKPACCKEWEAGLDRPECREGRIASGIANE